MKKLISILKQLCLVSTVAVCFSSYSKNSVADANYDYKEVMDYSSQAKMERQEERNRQIELQRYQQREYMQRQQSIYQQDQYNQLYQRGRALNVRFSSELSDR